MPSRICTMSESDDFQDRARKFRLPAAIVTALAASGLAAWVGYNNAGVVGAVAGAILGLLLGGLAGYHILPFPIPGLAAPLARAAVGSLAGALTGALLGALAGAFLSSIEDVRQGAIWGAAVGCLLVFCYVFYAEVKDR